MVKSSSERHAPIGTVLILVIWFGLVTTNFVSLLYLSFAWTTPGWMKAQGEGVGMHALATCIICNVLLACVSAIAHRPRATIGAAVAAFYPLVLALMGYLFFIFIVAPPEPPARSKSPPTWYSVMFLGILAAPAATWLLGPGRAMWRRRAAHGLGPSGAAEAGSGRAAE